MFSDESLLEARHSVQIVQVFHVRRDFVFHPRALLVLVLNGLWSVYLGGSATWELVVVPLALTVMPAVVVDSQLGSCLPMYSNEKHLHNGPFPTYHGLEFRFWPR